jgi:hypothetical protein
MIPRLILVSALLALPAAAQTAEPTPAPQPGDIAALLTPDGHTQFTLITPGGHVGFAAGDWSVMNVHGDMPAAAFAFHVPDNADANTEDSTEINIAFYQPDTRADRDAQAQFGKSLEPAGRPKKEIYKGWTIYTQSIVAKGTPYSLVDAESRQADVDVIVKLNWPHLPGQPGTHNADMRTMLLTTLDSMTAGTGTYVPQPGEVIHHPESR